MARSESSLAELLLNVDNRIREGRSKRKDADALVGGVEGAKQGAMSESASELRSAVETALAAAETEYLAAVKLLEPELRDRNRLATASPAGGHRRTARIWRSDWPIAMGPLGELPGAKTTIGARSSGTTRTARWRRIRPTRSRALTIAYSPS